MLLSVAVTVSSAADKSQYNGSKRLPAWTEGNLDIHFINTNRGDCAYLVFPDGTTMMVDAGDMENGEALVPDSTKTAAYWIADYVKSFAPKGNDGIDYFLLTHYHDDHYGSFYGPRPLHKEGGYRLSGVTELAEYLKINTLIDRGYDYPQDLRALTADGSSVSDISGDFRDWLRFVDYQCARHGMTHQKAQLGSRTQIVPLKHPVKDFGVRILFANAQVAAKQADTVASEYTPGDGQYNENCLSVGIKICYGDFDFYTGGDIAGIDWKGETYQESMESLAAPLIGEVDVATLNHHGNRDTQNYPYVQTVSPTVWIQQGHSRRHPGQDVLRRISAENARGERGDIFAIHIHAGAMGYLGDQILKYYKSIHGHIVIRVAPGGDRYKIFILNDLSKEREILAEYDYESKPAVITSGYPEPPRGVHPRLYLLEKDIPALRARVASPQGRDILQRMEKLVSPMDTTQWDAIQKDFLGKRDFHYYFEMRGLTTQVQLQSLDYLLEGNEEAGLKAVSSILDSLKNTHFPRYDGDLSRASGVMLWVGALVYDWCYPLLTEGQKEDFVREILRIADDTELGWPPKTRAVTGHGCEWMLLRDMLSAAIAIYDEYPQMYEKVAELLFGEYVPVRNYVYSGHNYHQGSGDYFPVRFTNDLISAWIFRSMGCGDIYSPEMQWVYYDYIYRRRPDGRMLPAGDVNPISPGMKMPYELSKAIPAMFAASYFGDQYIQYDFERDSLGLENHLLLYELLWRDFSLKGKSPVDLPLHWYSPAPYGWMISRTGWGDESVICEMKVNERMFGNHQHLDGGSFQIYCRGPLAIDSGSYEGTSGGYNSPHNRNYFKRTVAHNSLLVHDPDELFDLNGIRYEGGPMLSNDGGQWNPETGMTEADSYEELMDSCRGVGKVLAHAEGSDYSYLKGDITRAYNPSKVKDVRRSFVFLDRKSADIPAVLVVRDHVVPSSPAFSRTWLLHSIEEPQLGPDWFEVSRTKDGETGMLHCDILSGGSPVKIGGPGKEFWVDGENYPNAPVRYPDAANERGSWRVEEHISGEDATFFNVIQISSTARRKWLRVKRISANGVDGVAVGDRAVVFSSDGDRIDGDFKVRVPGRRRANMLFTDLTPGKWALTAGSYVTEFNVGENGCISIEMPAGEAVITKINPE